MNILLVSILIFAVCQGAAKAVSDSLIVGKREGTIFAKLPNNGFWGNDGSRKYAQGDPTLGDKFFLSSTLLVWLTDAWHAANMVQIMSQFATILIPVWVCFGFKIAFVTAAKFWIVRTMVFHILYTFVFKTKASSFIE